jgi:hypothetical protein
LLGSWTCLLITGVRSSLIKGSRVARAGDRARGDDGEDRLSSTVLVQ